MNVLSQEDELALEKNLVWVFADRRSGTTWLALELLSYQTKNMDEPLIGLHLGRYVHTKDGIKRTIEMQDERSDYFLSKKYKKSWNFFLRKLILNRIYNQFETLNEKIIIKEPTGSIAADILADCLPNSKIIILLRDPRDIIDSQIDEVSNGGWEIELKKGAREPLTEKKRNNIIKGTAIYWIGLMEILLNTYEKHSENLKYILRYEDLRKNTLPELQKLYQFIGINIDENNLKKIIDKFSFENIPEEKKGKGKFRRFATPGKWKENLNDEEKAVLNDILKDTLKKAGYD